MTRTNVCRDDRVHVMAHKCDTCIFRPGNLMHLHPGRKDQMLADAIRGQGVVPCHKTLGGGEAVCRGFFDVAKHEVSLLSVAERMDVITLVTSA
jgi:hypothetical protein